eukprot:scaffold956_cov389-Pavlova_lutheri.AAC.4
MGRSSQVLNPNQRNRPKARNSPVNGPRPVRVPQPSSEPRVGKAAPFEQPSSGALQAFHQAVRGKIDKQVHAQEKNDHLRSTTIPEKYPTSHVRGL